MMTCSLSHLADHVLVRDLKSLLVRDRATTAELLAHLAEVDERRLYLPAAYSSMYLYCVHELHMSEDAAFKRIRAARMARRFPAILPAIADGRLHLGAVVLLAPHLTEHTAADLLAAAEHRTKAAIELLLAERFPRPDLPTFVQAVAPPVARDAIALLPTAAPDPQLAPGPVVPTATTDHQLAPELVGPLTGSTMPMHPAPVTPRPRIAPLSPGRFALQVTVDQETHEQLRYAQSLLRHALPSGDVAEVLKRALDSLVRELEQKKFAKCARSRPGNNEANGRHVPAGIRRTVAQRDAGRCTFVSDNGKRCEASTWLEFDHVRAVARGGETASENLRLRCRAHNQYEAERVFGAGFMERKRHEARGRKTRAQAAAQAAEPDLQLAPGPVVPLAGPTMPMHPAVLMPHPRNEPLCPGTRCSACSPRK